MVQCNNYSCVELVGRGPGYSVANIYIVIRYKCMVVCPWQISLAVTGVCLVSPLSYLCYTVQWSQSISMKHVGSFVPYSNITLCLRNL